MPYTLPDTKAYQTWVFWYSRVSSFRYAFACLLNVLLIAIYHFLVMFFDLEVRKRTINKHTCCPHDNLWRWHCLSVLYSNSDINRIHLQQLVWADWRAHHSIRCTRIAPCVACPNRYPGQADDHLNNVCSGIENGGGLALTAPSSPGGCGTGCYCELIAKCTVLLENMTQDELIRRANSVVNCRQCNSTRKFIYVLCECAPVWQKDKTLTATGHTLQFRRRYDNQATTSTQRLRMATREQTQRGCTKLFSATTSGVIGTNMWYRYCTQVTRTKNNGHRLRLHAIVQE